MCVCAPIYILVYIIVLGVEWSLSKMHLFVTMSHVRNSRTSYETLQNECWMQKNKKETQLMQSIQKSLTAWQNKKKLTMNRQKRCARWNNKRKTGTDYRAHTIYAVRAERSFKNTHTTSSCRTSHLYFYMGLICVYTVIILWKQDDQLKGTRCHLYISYLEM